MQSIEAERHVVIVGYGRNGQRRALPRREACATSRSTSIRSAYASLRRAGDTVVFADGLRREALARRDARRAAVLLSPTLRLQSDARARHISASVPVIARATKPISRRSLRREASEVVYREAFESGLMLASHTLVWVGVPLSRVMRRVSQVRGERYGLLRGLFQGRDEMDAAAHLHSVTLEPGAGALEGARRAGRRLGVQARAAARRQGEARRSVGRALQSGDVVVLLGTPEALAAAEDRLR